VQRHEYRLEPDVVASTLLARSQEPEGLLVRDGPEGLVIASQASGAAEPLFELTSGPGSLLRLKMGETILDLNRQRVLQTEPDPLWPHAHSICSHMEADHSDSFGEFLKAFWPEAGEVTGMTMPWVERQGFFLSLQRMGLVEYRFIAFPTPCETANEVRKNLILMLREIRQ